MTQVRNGEGGVVGMPKLSGTFYCEPCEKSFVWKAAPRKDECVMFGSPLWENVAACTVNDYDKSYTIEIYCPICVRHYFIKEYEEGRE